MKSGEINLSAINNITVESSSKVECNDKLIMVFPDGEREELNVIITADFSKIKPEHHQIFLQSFSAKYNHNTQIFNTHTRHDGSKVPTVKAPMVERPFWKFW